MMAVATFWDIGADVANGNSTAITVANPMIQAKNIRGRGVVSRSRCMIAVATSEASIAAAAYSAVAALPHVPSWRGATMGMLSNPRHIRMPTSAIRAATSAVAAPVLVENSAASADLGFHAACRYSLISPASLVRRWIWVGEAGKAMTSGSSSGACRLMPSP